MQAALSSRVAVAKRPVSIKPQQVPRRPAGRVCVGVAAPACRRGRWRVSWGGDKEPPLRPCGRDRAVAPCQPRPAASYPPGCGGAALPRRCADLPQPQPRGYTTSRPGRTWHAALGVEAGSLRPQLAAPPRHACACAGWLSPPRPPARPPTGSPLREDGRRRLQGHPEGVWPGSPWSLAEQKPAAGGARRRRPYAARRLPPPRRPSAHVDAAFCCPLLCRPPPASR